MGNTSSLAADLEQILDGARGSNTFDLARALTILRQNPGSDIALAQLLERDTAAEVALRILDLIQELSSSERLQMRLVPLLEHQDPRVRSKTALVLAGSGNSVHWLKLLLSNPDPRVRANAVEAAWGRRSPEHTEFLRIASCDTHHRVAANAWLGLLMAGDAAAAQELRRLSEDSDANFRSAAAWAMGRAGDAQFLPRLSAMLGQESGRHRLCVLRAIAAIRRAPLAPVAEPPPAPEAAPEP